MPSTSKAQHNLMEAVAHDAKFAKKAGIPQSVGRDFANADARQSMGRGKSSADEGKSKRGRIYNHPRSQKAREGG